jgi:hypothetical protein
LLGLNDRRVQGCRSGGRQRQNSQTRDQHLAAQLGATGKRSYHGFSVGNIGNLSVVAARPMCLKPHGLAF